MCYNKDNKGGSAVEVYGDILFLINAGMDALCLLMTARLMHIPQKTWRWLIASAVGGVYAVAVLWMNVGQPWGFLIDMSICLLMCGISFHHKGSLRRIPLYGIVYMALSMVMGGVMTALYQLLRRAGIAAWLPGGDDSISSVAFLLLAVLGGLVTHGWSQFFKKKHITKTCTLTIRVGEREVSVTGMEDSGNLLRDPMGGGVVIPVKIQAVIPLLSSPMQALLSKQDIGSESLWELPEAHRVRLIPTGTATGEGMMIALRPDEILLHIDGKSPYAIKALIAPTTLPESPADALLPSDLMI